MDSIINTIFLLSAFVPLILGLGYLFRPKKMKKLQAWFRKKIEKMDTRVYKHRRAMGFGMVSLGLMMIYTYFQPIWIYNMFVIARVVMGVLFPEAFQDVQQVQATPMVCI